MDRAMPGRTTALCAMIQAVGGGLGWSVVPPLMPQIARELGISHAMGGVVWGAASLGIALASLLGGAAVDRFGPRRVASLALLAGSAACAARAWATGPWSLAAAMLVFGLHIGFCAPAIPKALAAHVPAARLARANGVALVGYTLGTAATVVLAPAVLVPLVGGWRGAMIVASAAMLLVALIWGLFVRDGRASGTHASLAEIARLVRLPALVRVAVMYFLLFGGYLAMLGLLPRALLEAGMPPARVGLAVAAWLTAAGIANYAGPWMSDRLRRRRPVLLGGAAVAGIALGTLALAPAGLAVPLLVVAALGGGCVAPLLFALPAEIEGVGPARLGAAFGLMTLLGQVGGFLLPTITGATAQASGVHGAIGALALAHLLILVPALGMRDTPAGRPAPSGALAA
jgi:MFS transporter, ACS family, aldohexuronate transporter